jgi:AraC-like DNA-binding protein
MSHFGAAWRQIMSTNFSTVSAGHDTPSPLAGADLLSRQPIFRAGDLESVCDFLCGVFAPHRLTYRTRRRLLDFRHRGAKVGEVEFNVMGYGGEIMVSAPDWPDFYLVQFMLEGSCQVIQEGHTYDMRPGAVAVVNPGRPFTKVWSEAGRQLLLRIDRGLLEREFRAWSGQDHHARIDFNQTRTVLMRDVGALTHVVRMLCEVLGDEGAALDHPFVRNRVVATLASALLLELPHNHRDALEVGESTIAPACVRRAERFMEDNATNAVGLSDVAAATGVSVRSLQMAFRRFRDTTPMARLRALRLELVREELARGTRDGTTVTSVAVAHGFGSPGRFAADYRARFGESPSETLRRGRGAW